MNDNDELTDLERDLARLLDQETALGTNKGGSEMMNEMIDEPGQRGMSDIDSPPPKFSLDEPSLSDFDSEYKRMENDLNEEDSQFERNYMHDDSMANGLNEQGMSDFENEEFGRDLNEGLKEDTFSDFNREFRRYRPSDESIMSDFGQEDNFDPGYKRAGNIDEDAWAADFDDDFQNPDNRYLHEDIDGRFLHHEFDNGADFDELSPADDMNEDEMRGMKQRGYEHLMDDENNFENDNDMREEDEFAALFGRDDGEDGDGDGTDGDGDDSDGDDGPGDRGLNDGEREILRRLVESILGQKNDGEA